jgi:general stress protein 26
VLLNLAEHRRKTGCIRRNPQVTMLLMNPENPYHWVSVKATAEREVTEDDPAEGSRATETIDQSWTKYTGAEPPYGLRDPAMDERRVLFECRVDSVAVFGRP